MRKTMITHHITQQSQQTNLKEWQTWKRLSSNKKKIVFLTLPTNTNHASTSSLFAWEAAVAAGSAKNDTHKYNPSIKRKNKNYTKKVTCQKTLYLNNTRTSPLNLKSLFDILMYNFYSFTFTFLGTIILLPSFLKPNRPMKMSYTLIPTKQALKK